jgi:hypothetical protein
MRMEAILAGALLAMAGAHSLGAATTQEFQNQKVAVTEETLAPGESETLTGAHPSAVVYFAGDQAELKYKNGSVHQETIRRGETLNEPAHAGTLVNTGAHPLRLVRVEFLTAGGDATWGRQGLPPNYHILFEDRYSRTYDIRIPAHAREPQHTHKDRVVIGLSGASLEHILPDGRIQPSTLKTDEVVWRLGQTHVGHNVGDTDLWAIAVEPK